MALFGLPAPQNSEGRVLTEAFAALPAPGVHEEEPGCTLPTPIRARPRGSRVRFSFRRFSAPVRVDVRQQSVGRRVLRGRLVKRYGPRRRSFTWRGTGARDGILVARMRDSRGQTRRFALRRRRGRFTVLRPPIERARSCGLLARAALSRAAISRRLGLTVRFGVSEDARGRVEVRQRGRVLLRSTERTRVAGPTHRVRVGGSSGRRRGRVIVRIVVRRDGHIAVTRLGARVP